MTALILTTYNRPEYLAQCLHSLSNVNYPKDTLLIIVDDCSNEETRQLLNDFTLPIQIIKYFKPANKGIKDSLLTGYKLAFTYCNIAINIDGDAIVKPEFITRLLELQQQFPENIISGFNSRNKDGDKLRNPILSEHEGYAVKKYANGINMVVNRDLYDKYIHKGLTSNTNWDFAASQGNSCIIAVPSLVQHVGINSSMGHGNNPDVACDFKLLSLPDVTLFGIDAHDPAGIKRAAQICTKDVEFGDVKIITERLFSGREAYSKFMIADLWEHVKDCAGTHILTIHGDGFITNPQAWDNEWLKVDYLGATWIYKDGFNVGNGGVSLRSKKFIEACSQLDIEDYHPEDCKLSRKYRPFLEKHFGLKWGTEEQANRFCIEAYGCNTMTDSEGKNAAKYSGQFAFHGYSVIGLPVQPVAKAGMPNKTKIHPVNAYKQRNLLRR